MPQAETNDYPLLESLQSQRESLSFEPLNIDLLQAQTGSIDSNLAAKAQRTLRAKWDLRVEQDARNAESIDINQQLAQFSEKEVALMFKNLVSLQLTDGCNGNCPFCMFGLKSGVTAKYSFESLQKLFQERVDLMKQNSFLLYWDSDPFDYRDGEYSFVDVYKLYEGLLPDNYHYISTAIPRGGEDDFINFMTYMIDAHHDTQNTGRRIVPVRISLTEQNIQRVEATLKQLTDALLKKGYKAEEINAFYGSIIATVGRFDNYLLPIGPLIKKADDLKDMRSTTCRDGVVLSPKTSQAIMMTAATIYEPSGQINIDLRPGLLLQQIPAKMREEHYATFSFGEDSLRFRTEQRHTMIPPVRLWDGTEYTIPDAIADMTMKLGREAAALTRVISNISRLTVLKMKGTDTLAQKAAFLRVSAEVFRERQRYINDLLASVEAFLNGKDPSVSNDEREKLEYYVLLTKIHVEKVNFLVSQIERNRAVHILSSMASVLANIGRENIHLLPNVLIKLNQMDDAQEVALHQFDSEVIKKFVESVESPIDIRKAQKHHAEEIVRVLLTGWLYAYSNNEHRISESVVRQKFGDVSAKIATIGKYLDSSKDDPRTTYLIASGSGKLLGFIYATMSEDKLYVHALYVDPEYHRKGIGKLLLNEAIDLHPEASQSVVDVVAYNKQAIEFYLASGFSMNGPSHTSFGDFPGGITVPEVHMVKNTREISKI